MNHPIAAVIIFVFIITGIAVQPDTSRPIWFGTQLDPQTVMDAAQILATSTVDSGSPR